MVLFQFEQSIVTDNLPVDVIKVLHHNTYLLDVQLNEYELINQITSNFDVVSMQSNNDCAYIDVYERLTTSYTVLQAEDKLVHLIEKLDLLAFTEPQIICISWQMDRNYIVDYRINRLLEAGHKVVCAGGNQDLPVLDISPVAVDGVIRVGGNKHNGKYQNWIDLYDITVPDINCSNEAAHRVCEIMTNKELELEYKLDFYSESHIRSAPWPLRLAQTPSSNHKVYEFNPVSNLRYIAGEHLLPSRPGDVTSVLSGSTPLENFVGVDNIELDSNMPRGITFDPNVGWLYGTFKYKEAMFHKILADINGQLFEYHIISCDADSKPSYDEVKQTYFNRPYDAPPFTLREYWVPMARPVKLLEPGDPFIRTYNLNDLHLYRSYE